MFEIQLLLNQLISPTMMLLPLFHHHQHHLYHQQFNTIELPQRRKNLSDRFYTSKFFCFESIRFVFIRIDTIHFIIFIQYYTLTNCVLLFFSRECDGIGSNTDLDSCGFIQSIRKRLVVVSFFGFLLYRAVVIHFYIDIQTKRICCFCLLFPY